MSPSPPLSPCQTPLPILYVDRELVLVNKPSGLLSVPGRDPRYYDSVYSRLLAHFGDIHVVHRLDMDTSGVMVMARHKEALRHLSRQFQQRTTSKHYLAWVDGQLLQPEGEVNLPLRCDWPNRPRQMVDMLAGKPSLTRYKLCHYDRARDASLVRLYPHTGRSHQLRVHMAALGHPILGCRFYATDRALAKAPRLQLHAEYLRVLQPATDLPISQQVGAADFFQTPTAG